MKECITMIGMMVLMIITTVCGIHFSEALTKDLVTADTHTTGGILILAGVGGFAEALAAVGVVGGNKKGCFAQQAKQPFYCLN